MEFETTTFLLEVLNFLILVWLLKRFFYRPVLAVIERRQARTADVLAEAAARHGQAEALHRDYQQRLEALDHERQAARAALEAEIATTRARQLTEVAAEAEAERQRRQLLEARATEERQRVLEQQARELAVAFASRFLDPLAGPELEARLVALVLADLERPGAGPFDMLRETDQPVEVHSAHPLDAAQRQALSQALGRLAGRSLVPVFREDAGLKAGLRIMAGSWVLMASLHDELRFFAGNGHGGA